MCDNTSAINLSKNPILRSHVKHIDIRHHFIKEHLNNVNICINYILTNEQLADIFTKALDKNRFEYLRNEIGVCSPF